MGKYLNKYYLNVPAADGSAIVSGPGPMVALPLCKRMLNIFAKAVLVFALTTSGCCCTV